MSEIKKIFYIIVGLVGAISIGFGYTPNHFIACFFATFFGYAAILLSMKFCTRFFWGWALFALTFFIRDSWLLSHPYSYIYAVYILISILFSLPYAYLSEKFSKKKPTICCCLQYASLFALCEFFYTQIPCGYSFQCAALHTTWSLQILQILSVIGALGLSFIVYTINFFFYRAITESKWTLFICSIALLFSTTFFLTEYKKHILENFFSKPSREKLTYRIALCHLEEAPDVDSNFMPPNLLHEQKWGKIFPLLSSLRPGSADLILLPEGTIPFPAQSPLFTTIHLPKIYPHPASPSLSSLEICSLLANTHKIPLIIGLEDRSIDESGTLRAHNSCFLIQPNNKKIQRYDKQLLLPLGEYIPFPFLKKALSAYGIHEGFSPGTHTHILSIGSIRIVPVICYEETFSSYHTKTTKYHPTVIIGLSNDVWYPAISDIHNELARIKAIEIGIPMARSCNKGKSTAYDSLGRCLATLYGKNQCTIVSIPIPREPSFFSIIGEKTVAFLLLTIVLFTMYRCNKNGKFK